MNLMNSLYNFSEQNCPQNSYGVQFRFQSSKRCDIKHLKNKKLYCIEFLRIIVSLQLSATLIWDILEACSHCFLSYMIETPKANLQICAKANSNQSIHNRSMATFVRNPVLVKTALTIPEL